MRRLRLLLGAAGAQIRHSLGVLELKLAHHMVQNYRVGNLFQFLDKKIAHGKRNFRQQTAPDGGAACQGYHDNAEVFLMADFIFGKGADLSGIVLSQTLTQTLEISLLNTGELPDFLIVRIVYAPGFSAVKEGAGIILCKLFPNMGVQAVGGRQIIGRNR